MTDLFSLTRREFIVTGAALSLSGTVANGSSVKESVIGPLVGHTDSTSTILWARFPTSGQYTLTIAPSSGDGPPIQATAEATAESDGTVKWAISGLSPATKYTVDLEGGRPCTLTTAPTNDQPTKVKIAFGSCAEEDAGTRAVWSRMAAEYPDAVVLAGDTPYIDTTDLARQRNRHREFAAVPEYQSLLSTRPFWSTWDDHDFGAGDADGTLKRKENSRQAFSEYRPQASYGDGEGGIYTSFRWGPIEVFVIDARWWAWTGPSFADSTKKTLLGQSQWDWLTTGLASSTAPFKVLASGCIWDDKKNNEKDDWETYRHERDALFDFIKHNRIGGVVLFGGDVHVSRLLRHPSQHVGYPLHEFISSPLHAHVIPELNVPHPSLVQSKLQPNTFLTLTADTTIQPPTLTARFLDVEGKSLFADTTIKVDELTPAAG
ncbi:MAG: alkaline phosphatase D family protein [Planctomycetota bacterium]|nr:alkaline phosphatase D family protein [Planctomycetota bacterium]MDA1211173.1 alkaline phosphatase D family protein [Planctomycetota bacterium]